jgi:hypothetical protein
MDSEEGYNMVVNEDIAPLLEQRARAQGNEELADNLAAERGDYTLSDYLKPSREDIGPFTAGAAVGGAAFIYTAGLGEKSAAGVVAGAALGGYIAERWSERKLGAKAVENSLEQWKEKFAVGSHEGEPYGEEYREDPESEFGIQDDGSGELLEE